MQKEKSPKEWRGQKWSEFLIPFSIYLAVHVHVHCLSVYTGKVMAMSQLRGHTCTSSLYIAFCGGLGHQHTKGTYGSQYQSTYERTEPSKPKMSDNVSDEYSPPHRELRPLLFWNSVWVL